MPQTFVLPRQTALDDDANPLAGALLYFYATGTTNPQAVYSDATLTTAHANPVVADSSGEFPKIYLNSASETNYRVRLTTAAGIQLYQEDDIDRFTISQAEVGRSLYPLTDAEDEASATPTNFTIPPYEANRYGFSPAATAATNTVALQACINAMEEATQLKTFTPDGYGANTYTGPTIVIPDGVYEINADIVLPAYCVIRANKVILVQTVVTEDHFSTTSPYRIDIEGISFKDGRRALTCTGGSSANTARVRMARCEFHTRNITNYAVLVDNGTMNMMFEDCRVLDSPLWLDVYGDYCEIKDCWVTGHLRSSGLKPDNTCSVNNRTRYMYVHGGSWVPQVDGMGSSTSTRWFDNGNGPDGGFLVLDHVQFGAENGGLPIVYEFGNAAQTSAQSNPWIALNGVFVHGCQLSQGASGRADRGVVVLQGSVPSIIDIRGGSYVISGKVISDAGFTSPTLSEWLLDNYDTVSSLWPKLAINVEDVGGHGHELVPTALLPFARIKETSRGVNPGKHHLGVLNWPVTEYLPDWTGQQAHIQGNVSGQKRDPASTTYFTALTASKEVNDSNGTGACVIEIDATAHGEVTGPAGFISSAKFLVSLLATRSNNIQSVVTTVSAHNVDSSGGTSVGDVLQCQVTGTSATTVSIQLRINTTFTASSSTVTWTARMISNTSTVGSPGRHFSLVSA